MNSIKKYVALTLAAALALTSVSVTAAPAQLKKHSVAEVESQEVKFMHKIVSNLSLSELRNIVNAVVESSKAPFSDVTDLSALKGKTLVSLVESESGLFTVDEVTFESKVLVFKNDSLLQMTSPNGNHAIHGSYFFDNGNIVAKDLVSSEQYLFRIQKRQDGSEYRLVFADGSKLIFVPLQ